MRPREPPAAGFVFKSAVDRGRSVTATFTRSASPASRQRRVWRSWTSRRPPARGPHSSHTGSRVGAPCNEPPARGHIPRRRCVCSNAHCAVEMLQVKGDRMLLPLLLLHSLGAPVAPATPTTPTPRQVLSDPPVRVWFSSDGEYHFGDRAKVYDQAVEDGI